MTIAVCSSPEESFPVFVLLARDPARPNYPVRLLTGLSDFQCAARKSDSQIQGSGREKQVTKRHQLKSEETIVSCFTNT